MDMGQGLEMAGERNRRITAEIAEQAPRLRNFVRRRVADAAAAEDILQDVFFELVESYRLPRPVEEVGAWLFRVARNRITDFYRKKRPESLEALAQAATDDHHGVEIADLLPSPEAGP